MALPASFLDALRDRVKLSELIGQTVKVVKAGREFKACCPFHGEKTPSFTINDAKGFYHCFGCGAHGDVIRWMMDGQGLGFIDAVKELAARVGVDMPEASPEQRQREERIDTARAALDKAQAIYRRQLEPAGAVLEYLSQRRIGPEEIEVFGIGYARGQDGSLRGSGIGERLGVMAGLLVRREDESLREVFYDRITIPIHDARGRLVGFGGRVWPGRRGDQPKFVNSPDSPIFDKGRTLFNLHRAAPAARPLAANRLIVVEGYFDVVAMTRGGFPECVAPMGTALTEAQLERLWRVHHRPILLFDGDKAGRAAALRAAKLALPALGPGRELRVALLPEGKDPDDLLLLDASGMGKRVIVGALEAAKPPHELLFEATADGVDRESAPEAIAQVWAQLADMAGQISEPETRAQYLGLWRARFEREISAVPQIVPEQALHSITYADDGDYAFPESESDSAGRLIALVRAVLKRREERRAITEEIRELMKMAELAGFQKKAITAAVQDIESDLEHGPAKREEDEMQRVLYRRVLGIRGPMTEAMMPQLIEGRPRGASPQIKRRATVHALIDAGGASV
ncbi:DNA primase [Novosphingobium sp. SG751A]|uniref:DNA primase n=1 Tax=Novosphingobium sp. SG751A TaxID=2587000 RepID=UPI001556FFFF|nr:DNA primase [Novosphingobium sp. SG751A]NOW44089.1 DNA primase [Novosphingobium sp. SG751A]